MKSVIVGAGAIGAYVGAAMARAGQDVTLFARGAHLQAMQENGVTVQSATGEYNVRPKVSTDLESIGPVDVVFLAVKAHSLPEVAPRIRPLLGTETVTFPGPIQAGLIYASGSQTALGTATFTNVSVGP